MIGEKAPEINVKDWVDKNGNVIDPLHLSNFIGKKIVIFGFQSWCPGCHSSGFPTLKALVEKYKDNENIVFLAVQTVFEGFDSNTYEKMIETQKKYNLQIPFGHDTGNNKTQNKSDIMHNYQTHGTPWFIFLNEEHEVVFSDFHIDMDSASVFLN